ncbi:hypothetical protein [Streptomyces sp. N35]|uniref:hypothetical protein n=1 Tax=Streptomyces sp. N35 TaxID=2795730 RepID=UPI0018F4DB89|nr:hypothetical protein [Streptomyces sp. N35]
MTADAYQPGDVVVTTFADPDLPEGSMGTIAEVHDDPVDGVDVEFPMGRFNVVASGLQPGDPTD